MSTESKTSSGGVSFFGALFLVLLTLKLTGYIDWPWVWVAAPLWVLPSLVLVIWLFLVIGSKVVKAIERKRDDRARLLGKDAP